ncbi:hypothetical protein [Paenibacillus sp. HWE-109]|nr:hypothetical protein [Paenibacillus sp. HWE-109]
MKWAVYYKSRRLTPPVPDRDVAEQHLKKLKYTFANIDVKEVM